MNKTKRVSTRVNSPEKLRRFRKRWSGKRLLKLLRKYGGRLAVNWEIGVGKSHSIDNVIEEGVKNNRYDLIVCLSPTRQLIEERRWIKTPPPGIKIVNLRPRPKKDCGQSRNREWRKLEKRGMGLLGRAEICKHCPKRGICFWPEQYGKALKRTRVIYATQAHLDRSPFFIEQLKKWTRANSVLVLIDEVGFVCTPLRYEISFRDVEQFYTTLKANAKNSKPTKKLKHWLYLLDLLLKAPTEDLRCNQWSFSPLSPGLSVKLQDLGGTLYGDDFNFIAYDLVKFGNSLKKSRERHKTGAVSYAIQPFINCAVIIYSGTVAHEFLKFRIGKDFANPFEMYQFRHKRTVWYNISSNTGTRLYFSRNAPQILDFYAQLIAMRVSEGKKPLLVAKKRFISLCVVELNQRLKDFGFGNIKVVAVNKKTGPPGRNAVPIINYGMIGINSFQAYDCAYCLTGYYVNERIVNSILQDIVASDHHIPIKIKTGGMPRRRRAGVIILHHLVTIEMPFIQTAAKIEWAGVGLNQEEFDAVKYEYKKAIKKLKKRITKHGIENPLSRKELQRFFRKAGLLNLFKLHGQYSFEKEQLKRNIVAHPVVADLIKYKRLNNLIATASKLADFVACDERVHAQYDSIGSVSGRLTTQNPNIVGLDSRLRPLIIPEHGKGIGEVDWSQFEVGVAAVVYRDDKLVRMFNKGDVYTLMAKEFFKAKLSNSELKLSDHRFKQRFPDFRKRMKICVLGVIYGMEPYTISELLKCSKTEAQQLYRKFMRMFPRLKKATDETSAINKRCGSATTVTGLRRHRSTIDSGQKGKENWLINHPIQGTAAAIFKATANRLDKLYRPHEAQIIIPMHDAFVFEAPTEALCEVAELTERVMCETVREFFPELQPKVEVNISDPTCWGQKEKLAKSL